MYLNEFLTTYFRGLIMSYTDMELRWGTAFAHYLLREIEKATFLKPQESLDPEIRLANALRIQDAMNLASIAA